MTLRMLGGDPRAAAVPHKEKTGLSSLVRKMGGRGFGKEIKVNLGQGVVETYLVGKKLGKGTTAVVKQGMVKETGERVAIKIRAKGSEKKKEQEGFRKECAAMQAIRHPNCIALFATHEDRSNLYMVLELMEGGSVMDRILEVDVFTQSDAVTVMKGALSALQYLHSHGIAHRDIKPDNLMYASKDPRSPHYNTIKLADFGFAKRVDNQHVMKTVCGTPLYIAPEILGADHSNTSGYGCEVDIWSMGVVLYLLLCGFPPFIEQDVWKLFELVKQGNVNFPSPYWDGVSDEAMHLILQMLVPDHEQRWTAEQCLCHPFVHGAGTTPLRKLHSFHKAFTLVRKLPIFANIDAEVLQQVSDNLRRVEFKAGQTVIQTGQQATCMYFVSKGSCVVMSNGKQIDRLSTGDFFGEIALACDVRRTADVLAGGDQDLQLYELSRDNFMHMLQAYPILESRVAEVADRRVRRISMSYEGTEENDSGQRLPVIYQEGADAQHWESDECNRSESDSDQQEDGYFGELSNGQDNPKSDHSADDSGRSVESGDDSDEMGTRSVHEKSRKRAGCVVS